MAIEDKDKLEVLAAQCHSIDGKITSYHLVGSRVLGIGTVIIAGVLATSIKEKFDTLLLILPLAMYTILFYWINTNTWIVANGGYKKLLEERINEIAGEPLYMWESAIVEKRHTNITNRVLDLIYAVVLFLSIPGSFYATHGDSQQQFILVVTHTIFVILLLASLIHLKSEFKQTYEDANAYLCKYNDTHNYIQKSQDSTNI